MSQGAISGLTHRGKHAVSFDHLVGGGEERWRKGDARALAIFRSITRSNLVAPAPAGRRLLAPEDAPGIAGRAPEHVGVVDAVGTSARHRRRTSVANKSRADGCVQRAVTIVIRAPRVTFAGSSTDSNLAMSLGIPAVTIGSGGEGGNWHSRNEWYRQVDAWYGPQNALLTCWC